MSARRKLFAIAAAVAVSIGGSQRVAAQGSDESVGLGVQAGRPLRVARHERIRVTHAGQPVSGRLVEPVYACDRIVIPVGARVLGHVDTLENASKLTRVRARLGGDFSPLRRAVLQFDSIVSSDGGGGYRFRPSSEAAPRTSGERSLAAARTRANPES